MATNVVDPNFLRGLFEGWGWYDDDSDCAYSLNQIEDAQIPAAFLELGGRAPEWIQIWFYLGDRSYGSERRGVILDLIRRDELSLITPMHMISGDYADKLRDVQLRLPRQ